MTIRVEVTLNNRQIDEDYFIGLHNYFREIMDQTEQIRTELKELRTSLSNVAVGVDGILTNNAELKAKVEELKGLLGDSIDGTEAATLITEIDELTSNSDQLASALASALPPADGGEETPPEDGGEGEPTEGGDDLPIEDGDDELPEG